MQDDDRWGEPWLIISDLARRLGRSDSTVGKWARLYGDLLPARRVGPRSLAYPLAAFVRIQALAEERLTPREIRAALATDQAESARPRATLEDVLAALTVSIAVLEEIRDLLRQLVERGPSPS